jgi:hypothetical protein
MKHLIKKLKKEEKLKAFFNFIDTDLYKLASDSYLSTFPLLVVFTVREDLFKGWEEAFDGREITHLKKTISKYDTNQFNLAIAKYSKQYHFKITNENNLKK